MLDDLRNRLAAAHAEFRARQYSAAGDGYAAIQTSINDITSIYNYTTDLQQIRIDASIGAADVGLELGFFDGALEGWSFILLAFAGTLGSLSPVQISYAFLRLVTLYLDWGNSAFRNGQAPDALPQYTQVIAVDGSVPSTDLYLNFPILQPASDDGVKIINNVQALIGGQTTAEALNVNPVLAATIIEIHQQIIKIQNGLDYWGHYTNTIPIWTFDYLQAAAANFAQFAINAERDFINFQERSDQGSATRQQLMQLVSQANAEIDAASAQVDTAQAEELAYKDGAALANRRFDDANHNADEYDKASALAITFQAESIQVGGGDSLDPLALTSFADTIREGAGFQFGEHSPASHALVSAAVELAGARLTQKYEVDSLRRTAQEMQVAASQAQAEADAAAAKTKAAVAAEAVARLHSEGAQQNLLAFDSQTFTPDVWQRMADSMWRLYRRYLDMALKTALLMQQAYNFETDQSLRFIKNDYSTDEVKGLLGAEALMADIQSFTYDLITSTTGKAQPVRQTISLAQRYAYLFETQFRQTGVMEFETRIDDFDYVYPGTYAGRLESVEVEVVGLVPPSGISGSLTNTGISAYRTPTSASALGSSGLKYRVQPRETLVISEFSAPNDLALISPDARQRRIFEGAGLVSSWRLELPRGINDIDYGALLDVRLTFLYKARYDPDLHDSVIAELESRPDIHARQRGMPLRWIYPDAFFRFQDTGILGFSQKAQDFPSNETKPVITSVGVLVATGGDSLAEPVTFDLSLPGTAVVTATTDASGSADGTAQNSPLGSLVGGSAIGDYALTMTSADNPQFIKDGRFDLSPIVNVVLILGYSFTPKGPSNAITAPSGNWEQLFPSASVFQPLDRGGHSAVYDPVTNRMIVFGGSKFEELPLLNDVEVLTSANGSPDDSQWITLMQPGIADAPSARANHTTVYDAQNNRMILFAGATGVNTFVSDVWVLSNANGVSGTPVWAQLSPAGVSPTPRAGHTAAYDPVNNRMIVFGGSNITEAFSDVWVLVNANGLGGQPQWIRLTPAGGPPPSVSSHTGVYDPAANTLTIFGGFTSFETGQVTNAVWNLTGANGLNSGTAWTALFPIGALPAPRAGHTAVYDATGNRMLIFGGGDGSGTVFFDDTWVLSNSSGTGNPPSWVRLNSSSKPPIARFFHAAMFDNVNRRMVIYGGSNNEGSFFSVWILKDLQ